MGIIIMLPHVALFAGCLMLGAIFGGAFPARWWFLRLGVIPFICLRLAIYILSFPGELPPDYDPMVHGNYGRQDAWAAIACAIILPTAYLATAFPLCLVYAVWRRRAGKG